MIRNKSYIFLVDRSINNKKRTENFCNIDAVSILIWLIPGTTKKKSLFHFLMNYVKIVLKACNVLLY